MAQKTMASIKLKTNVPEIMTFKFNSWKKWENQGKDGKYVTYSIGVENRGLDAYFSVYEKEYKNIFEKLGNLQDRTLEVLKYEDGKYKNWKIMENGVEITPKWGSDAQQAPTSHAAPQNSIQTPLPQNQPSQVNLEALEGRIKAGFSKRDEEIAKLREQLEYFAFLFKQNNPDAYELHKSSLPEAKEPEIPII